MENIVTFFLSFIETISATLICDCFFNKKYKGIKTPFFAAFTAAIVFICLWLLPPVKNISAVRIAVAFILYYILEYYLYNCSLLSKLVVTSVLIVLFYTIDIIAVGITINIFNLTFEDIMTFGDINIIVSLLSKAVLFMLCTVVNKTFENRSSEKLSLYSWIQITIYPLSSVLVIITFIDYAIILNTVPDIMLVCTISLVAGSILLFYTIKKLEYEKAVQEQNKLLEQRIQTEMNNTSALMEAYSRQRKITHDFSNHLTVINSLTINNQYEHLEEYVQSLYNDLSAYTLPIKTNNPVVDALLNRKYLFAVKNDIDVIFNINDLSMLNISNEDIVVLLANVIDNAIEACMKCTGYREIKIKMSNNDKSVDLSVKNTVDRKIDVSKSEIKSTKTDFYNHGYGLRNIKAIIEKYNGNMILYCDDKQFTITVTLKKHREGA